MPVILAPAGCDAWLDPATPAAELKRMLRPHPADGMECAAV
jgi:putative SOS response-associated peptidase YedK